MTEAKQKQPLQAPFVNAPMPDGVHNEPYWAESRETAAEKVNDKHHPRNSPKAEELVIADRWEYPTNVPGLTEHAHHPGWVLFGYEVPGGQR